MKPQDQWTTAPHSDGVWPNEGLYGKVSGNVWYETGDLSGSDSRAWKKDSWDVNATGVKVVASYVNDEITRQFDTWKEENKGYTLEDFRAAQQEIVNAYQAEHGEGSHIAETVVGTVESDGSYYIPFRGLYGVSAQNKGARTSDEEYGQLVADADVNHKSLMQWNGTLGQRHRHINSDYMYISPMIDDYAIWSNNYQNNMFTTADAGRDIFDAEMLASANGRKQNFAALAPQPMHDVLVYDSVENYAIPGDTVESKSGGLLPSREYQIQWFKDGEAIGDPVTKVSNVDGTIGSVPITVPIDLDKNAIYTSAIFQPNEKTTNLSDALAVDSFTAVVDQNIIHEPAYPTTEATPGEEATATPTFTTKNGEAVQNTDVPLATENAFQIDPNATDVPKGAKINRMTGEITFVPTKEQVGEITVPVVVTYEDGTTDTVEAKFTVKSNADKYDPKGKEQQVEIGKEPNATESIENFTDLPKGTTAEFETPVDTKTPGAKDATVVVTYPDGSTDKVDVKVNVVDSRKDAEKYDPKGQDQEVKLGEKPDATKSISNLTDLPEETKAEFETPVDTSTEGEKPATVVVTYPDGSTDKVDVKVNVVDSRKDAEKYDPKGQDQEVKLGEKPDATKSISNLTDLPEETKAEFETPVDTSTEGEKPATVVVTYPDGTTDEVPVKVNVVDSRTDAEKYNPEGQGQTVEKGSTPDAKDSISNLKDLPEGTKAEFETPVDTSTVGEKPAKVVVTYPDGSKDTVDVKVTVKEKLTDADKYNPEGQDQTVEKGSTPDAKDSISNLKDLPEETKAEFETPVDTSTVGEKPAKVVVTYPDGSKDTVDVKVTVKEKLTDADKYNPEGQDQAVEKGSTPKAEDSISNLKDLPEGTKAEFETPVDTSTVGEKPAKVVVTYPDGSKDTVDVKVTVKEKLTDADKYNPEGQDQAVEKGSTPKAEDSISNLKDLPEGTKVEFETPVDTSTVGEKPAKVVVTYPDGSKDTVDVTVTVTDTMAPDAPMINPVQPGDKAISGTAKPNEKVDVTLPDGTVIKDVPVDKEGNWTVEVPEGTTLKEGDKVTAVAKDANGNTSKETTVTVTDTMAPDAPMINPVQPGDKTISGTAEPNGKVDVTLPDGTVIKDVPVDKEGNWTVEVPEGTTLKEGDKVTAVAKDANGNTSKETTVTVTDTMAPDAPMINPVQPGDKTISGTAEPNGKVDVTLPDGTVIKDVPVDKEGNWTVEVPEGTTLKEGDKVTAVAKDANGNTSKETTVTVTDTMAPDAPMINPVQPGDKTISGTAEPNGKVDVTLPDGTVIKDVPVDKEGNWTVEVPEGTTLKEGDKVTAVAKDANGNTSKETTVTVTDTMAPDAPMINPVQPGDKTISGTAEPNGKVDVTLPDGTVIKDVPVDKEGNWTVEVPEGTTLKEGDKVTAVAKDANGNTSKETTVTVTDTMAPDAPMINPVQPGDKTISGTAEPNGKVDVTLPDGTVIKDVPVDKEGNWTVEVPEGTTLKEGDKVTAVAKDANGNTSKETTVTVTDTMAPDAPMINPVQPGDKTISGTAEPNGKVDVTLPDGTVIKDVPVDKEGNWTVKVPEGTTLKDGDKVTAVAKDANGNTSKETTVTVKDTMAPDAPTVNPVKPGDKVVSGKGEPHAKITVKFPNGKEATGTVDKDGNWMVDVPEGTMLKDGDQLVVIATDEAGNTSEPTEVMVKGDQDVMAPEHNEDMDQGKEDMNQDQNTSSNTGGTSMPKASENNQNMKSSKAMTNNNGKKAKELPETGNESANATLFGSLIAALGSLFLFGRRRKENEEK
ncbi:Rib/alpha-like domain-containing protein [Staphylococcus sp. 17KM0847]|uniref:Rib/alpha-like domain-containing protein n=1 Tax=Staphylococcus sp. 17KM0847 TaxID=2583989 RepID=UPI0035B5B340